MVFVDVDTGFMVIEPVVGQVILLLLAVFAPGAQISSPELVITLQFKGRFMVRDTV